MARIADPYKCDVCDLLKQPSNHWFLGFDGKTFSVETPLNNDAVSTEATIIIPWKESAADHKDARHLCGIECVTKFVAKSISKN